jgi:tetratricopeptide (TPR) repeat protein
MRTALVIALLIIPTLSFAEAAPGESIPQTQKDRAKQLYKQAQIHYRTGKLEQSASEFEQSYELFPAPETLFNIAQTQRLLKNYERAVFFYRQFLATSEAGKTDRKMIQDRIAELEKLIEQQRQAQSAPPQEPEPPPARIGDKQTATSAPSGAFSTTLQTQRAEKPFYKNAAGITLAVGGVVLVGLGGALIGVALNEGAIARKATTQSDFNLRHGNDLTFQEAGWPILGAGIASLAASSITFALTRRHRR